MYKGDDRGDELHEDDLRGALLPSPGPFFWNIQLEAQRFREHFVEDDGSDASADTWWAFLLLPGIWDPSVGKYQSIVSSTSVSHDASLFPILHQVVPVADGASSRIIQSIKVIGGVALGCP